LVTRSRGSGEPFIIAKAGKPLVRVVPLETPEAGQIRRLGFMALRYLMISIGWEEPRWSRFSAAPREAFVGDTIAAVGGGAAERLPIAVRGLINAGAPIAIRGTDPPNCNKAKLPFTGSG
jgi:antitoxin (DNA-binding transcriptional repressor) of toxin-antitoxin stability system